MKPSTSLSIYQRLRYRFLFPTLIWSWFRSLLWPILYSFTLSFLLLTPFDRTHHPGYFLISSLAALLVGTYGSMALSSRIISLGYELRGYHLFKITQLWPLAFRAFSVPILSVFVITPLICYAMIHISEFPYRISWLVPINLCLLHLMFSSVAVYTTLSPRQGRLTKILYLVVCPYHILVGPVMVGSFWLLVIFGNILRAFWKGWEVMVTALLDKLANLADSVLLIPAIGPVVMFWLDPYFLLIRLHTSETYSTSAPFAFAGVCVLISSVIWVRVRSWLNADLEANGLIQYDAWLQFRMAVPFETWEETAHNSQSLHPSGEVVAVNPVTEGDRPAVSAVKSGHALPSQFIIPEANSADSYIRSFSPGRSIWPPRLTYILYLGAVSAAIAINKGMLLFIPALWILTTISSQGQANLFSWITPQRLIAGLRLRFRNQLKRIPVDCLMAILIPLVHSHKVESALVGLVLIFSARLFMLALITAYEYQMLFTVIVSSLVGAGCMIAGIVGIFTFETESTWEPHLGLMLCGGITLAVLVVWALLSYTLWRKYNGLVHKALIRQAGQM